MNTPRTADISHGYTKTNETDIENKMLSCIRPDLMNTSLWQLYKTVKDYTQTDIVENLWVIPDNASSLLFPFESKQIHFKLTTQLRHENTRFICDLRLTSYHQSLQSVLCCCAFPLQELEYETEGELKMPLGPPGTRN